MTFDKGPWTVETGTDDSIYLQSDDFTHDVSLKISGDFGDRTRKEAYAKFLAQVLSSGCLRQHALNTLRNDPAELMQSLESALGTQHGLLLLAASEEIARLQHALSEATEALSAFENAAYLRNRAQRRGEPSAFAEALKAAIGGVAPPTQT